MKIALISDIHGNLYALEAVLKDMKKQRVGLTVFLGDLVYGGVYPSECVSLIANIDPLIAIKGNADGWLDDRGDGPPNDHRAEIQSWVQRRLRQPEIALIQGFKPRDLIDHRGHLLSFCHGSPLSPDDRIYPEDDEEETRAKFRSVRVEVAAVGHTHVRMDLPLGSIRVINPGAVGISNDGDTRAAYGILTIDKTVEYEQRNIEYPIERYVADLRKSDMPNKENLAAQILSGEPNRSLFR